MKARRRGNPIRLNGLGQSGKSGQTICFFNSMGVEIWWESPCDEATASRMHFDSAACIPGAPEVSLQWQSLPAAIDARAAQGTGPWSGFNLTAHALFVVATYTSVLACVCDDSCSNQSLACSNAVHTCGTYELLTS